MTEDTIRIPLKHRLTVRVGNKDFNMESYAGSGRYRGLILCACSLFHWIHISRRNPPEEIDLVVTKKRTTGPEVFHCRGVYYYSYPLRRDVAQVEVRGVDGIWRMPFYSQTERVLQRLLGNGYRWGWFEVDRGRR